ncbi:TMF family protein [Spirosoma agri]|nr:TMF family protein [Spirosoma agri]
MVGSFAGVSNENGAGNTLIGVQAGQQNVTGSNNVYLGGLAGFRNANSDNNTAIGFQAGYSNVVSGNTFLGYQSGYNNTTAGANTFLGYQSGFTTTTGQANVFIGSAAGYTNSTGTGNLFLGQQAGYNTTSSYNLFMGNASGSTTTTGLGNTAIGDGSLLRNSTGTHNVAIGRFAGVESRNDENVFIGFAADVTPNTPNLTNATAIGARARVSQSNSIVLGANANVGIGTGAPSAKLHITTGVSGTSGLRLENLTSNNTAIVAGLTKFLTVDGAGNVILGTLSGSTREGVNDALWQRKGSFLQSTQGESIVIGQGVDKTPTGYSLFVGQGLLAEKVKVAVKNTSDWSDYVFKPGYALQPLAEVEQYIQEHEHLPGVASAKEMVEQGNDLHKTDAKLLAKIEELTLYSIQLEKAAKQQQAQIDELKQLVKQLADKK